MAKVRKLSQVSKELDATTLVERFLEECSAQGLTKDTLNSHRYALQAFFNVSEGLLSDEKVLKREVGQLLKGKQDAYYNKQLNALRQFFAYCIEEEVLQTNPAITYKYRRPTVQVVDHSEVSVKALLKVIDQTTFSGLRDYAFSIMILDTGIRPSEALQIKIEDIYLETKQLRVQREYSKTRRERYLPVSSQVLQILRKLISVRPTDWKEDVPVLCTYDGRRMPARNMQKRFRDYSLMIKEDISPYHLRHIFGLGFIRNGGDTFSLQRIMGHENLDMTKVYVNLANEDIQASHAKASPLVNLMNNKRVKKI